MSGSAFLFSKKYIIGRLESRTLLMQMKYHLIFPTDCIADIMPLEKSEISDITIIILEKFTVCSGTFVSHTCNI